MRRLGYLIPVLTLVSLQASAIPITFEFGGTLTQTTNNAFGGANEFPAAVIGEAFSGHVTFDSENFLRTDCAVCPSTNYTYTDTAPLGMSIDVTFGGFTIGTNSAYPPTLFLGPTLSSPGGVSRITMRNDDEVGSTVVDGYHFISQTVLPSGNFSGAYVTVDGEIVESPVAFLALDFTTGLDGDLSFLTSQELLLAPPDISLATNRTFSLLGGFPNTFVRGAVEYLRLDNATVVPEPSAPVLLALGLGLMIAFQIVAVRRRARA